METQEPHSASIKTDPGVENMTLLERIKRDRLRPPHNKGIIAFLKRKINPGMKIPNRKASIFINRYCNLDCYSCAALGMHPPPDETDLDDILKFIDIIAELYPKSTVMLTGGEPTMVSEEKLGIICSTLKNKGLSRAMLTNGFNIVPTEWFDYILLDYHGINHDELELWEKHLKDSNVKWEMKMKHWHQDTLHAMKDNITKGVRCSNWLTNLTLWKNVIYPCCNIMCVEWWKDTNEVTEALMESGWTVNNPHIIDTITNWRDTLPSTFYRLCSIGCWKDADKTKWVPIASFCEESDIATIDDKEESP